MPTHTDTDRREAEAKAKQAEAIRKNSGHQQGSNQQTHSNQTGSTGQSQASGQAVPEELKSLMQKLEQTLSSLPESPAKNHAIAKAHECFMWVGRGYQGGSQSQNPTGEGQPSRP